MHKSFRFHAGCGAFVDCCWNIAFLGKIENFLSEYMSVCYASDFEQNAFHIMQCIPNKHKNKSHEKDEIWDCAAVFQPFFPFLFCCLNVRIFYCISVLGYGKGRFWLFFGCGCFLAGTFVCRQRIFFYRGIINIAVIARHSHDSVDNIGSKHVANNLIT